MRIMLWRDAVIEALHRYSSRYSTRIVERQKLIDQELDQIIHDTNSTGDTPAQTLSRVLQELRDEEVLYFLGNGSYLLADTPVSVELEDLPDDALDFVVQKNLLAVGVLPADSRQAVARRRIGQDKLRRVTLENYSYRCALCDVPYPDLLVAGHISRWADDPKGRGDLANLICMCRFHDALFEHGYFSLADDYSVLRKPNINSRVIKSLLPGAIAFIEPKAYPPAAKYLAKHRSRFGF